MQGLSRFHWKPVRCLPKPPFATTYLSQTPTKKPPRKDSPSTKFQTVSFNFFILLFEAGRFWSVRYCRKILQVYANNQTNISRLFVNFNQTIKANSFRNNVHSVRITFIYRVNCTLANISRQKVTQNECFYNCYVFIHTLQTNLLSKYSSRLSLIKWRKFADEVPKRSRDGFLL